MRIIQIGVAMILLLVSLFQVSADEKGEEITKKYYDLPSADTIISEDLLILIDSKNNKRNRLVTRYIQDTDNGNNTFVEFLQPADVRGTKFLTLARKGEDDEQRLFLPALNKVRLIASHDKGGSFMGTGFSYYDLEDHVQEDFTSTFLRDETINNVEVHVVESIPIEDSPYSKRVLYIRKDNNFLLKVECYDEEGDFLKTILYLETKVYQGIIIPTKMAVDHRQAKEKTLLQVKSIKVNSKISNQVFSIQNLKR